MLTILVRTLPVSVTGAHRDAMSWITVAIIALLAVVVAKLVLSHFAPGVAQYL